MKLNWNIKLIKAIYCMIPFKFYLYPTFILFSIWSCWISQLYFCTGYLWNIITLFIADNFHWKLQLKWTKSVKLFKINQLFSGSIIFYFAECCVGKLKQQTFHHKIRVQKTITITDITYLSRWIIVRGY